MKTIVTRFLIVLSVFLTVISCRKDDDTPKDYIPSVSGSWKYFRGGTHEKYLQINLDRTCYVLIADEQGMHDKIAGVVLVTASQIVIDNGLSGEIPDIYIYNYKIRGDSMVLSKPSQNIVLLRDKSAPTASAWIKTVTAGTRIKAPINDVTDIAYDGALIWYGNGYASNYLYKFNPTNGAKDSIPVTVSAFAVEADGTDLWGSNDGGENISRISKSDGSILATSINMGAFIYGIAKDNDYLWCLSHGENTLYKYDTRDNTIPLSTVISGDWEGLAVANHNLYVASNGKLNKFTLAPLQATATYELAGYHVYGVAYDGSAFWVSAYKLPDAWPEIIKLAGMD